MLKLKIANNNLQGRREKLLEKRIEQLQNRIHELETEISLKISPAPTNDRFNKSTKKPSFLVLPVTYTPEPEKSPKVDIVLSSPMDETNTPLLLVEQLNNKVYETIV